MRISDWSSDVCSSDLLSVSQDDEVVIDILDGSVCKPIALSSIVDLSDRKKLYRAGEIICDGTSGTASPVEGTPVGASNSTGQVDLVATLTARSEEHTSELQSLMRISYAVFCLKKTKTTQNLATTLESHPPQTP